MLKELNQLFRKIILLSTILVNLTLLSFSKAKEYAVILIYHKFDEPKSPSTSIPLKDFEAQMKYLKKNKYNVVSLDKIVEYLKRGYFPAKTVAITIDDGYKSTMKAYKILKKYNFPFTVFLYMEAVAKYPDFLTKSQIEELKKYPKITFGNHSYSHKHFAIVKEGLNPQIFKEDFKKDVLKAEKRFKNLIGHKPIYYAYPYGDYNELMVDVLKKLGYKAIFTQDPASVGKYSNIYIIPRQPIVGHWGSLRHFIKILNTEPLPVKNYYPEFGILKENPPNEISADIENIQKYKNCGIYVSELGWNKVKKDKNKIFIKNIPKLKRWKNRIGFTCFNKETKKLSTFFYMVIKPK